MKQLTEPVVPTLGKPTKSTEIVHTYLPTYVFEEHKEASFGLINHNMRPVLEQEESYSNEKK
jgi:hypothetical protein